MSVCMCVCNGGLECGWVNYPTASNARLYSIISFLSALLSQGLEHFLKTETPFTGKCLSQILTVASFSPSLSTQVIIQFVARCLCERRYSSLDEIDVERLLALINKSFDRMLLQDYIESLQGRLHSIYLSEGCVLFQ